jgi:hypothetical protein
VTIVAPPVMGAGLPHAGPSEVPTIVPRNVLELTALRESTSVPGANTPFLQSTAIGDVMVAVHVPSVRRAGQVTPWSSMTFAQPDPHDVTRHIMAALPDTASGFDPPLKTAVYMPLKPPSA